MYTQEDFGMRSGIFELQSKKKKIFEATKPARTHNDESSDKSNNQRALDDANSTVQKDERRKTG
jgi:hypothetical protein